MGDRTSEGYAPDSGLEPDPAGKPDPEQIDPQLTAMLVDRLREGIGFPDTVRTIAEVVLWVNEARGKKVMLYEGTPDERAARAPGELTARQSIERAPHGHPSRPDTQDTTTVSTFVNQLLENSDLDAPSAFDIFGVCMELAIFLMGKNKAYGDSALDPVRIMSSADPVEQIRVRMDDKLSRLLRGHADGEDILKDLVGYWILMRVAEKRHAKD